MTDSLATLRKALGAQYHIERELGGGDVTRVRGVRDGVGP